MKKATLLAMFLIAITFSAKSQEPLNHVDPWGAWGIGKIINANSLNVYEPYHIDGYQIYFDWAELEPTPGNFDWDTLDADMNIVMDDSIWVAVQIMVGPNCPEWMYNDVPKVFTTGGNDDGPYPYYLDPKYKARYYNLLKQVADHFNHLSEKLQKHFLYWQITEGSTGDEDPYKGTPTNPMYNIDFYTWQDFRHAAWDSAELYAGPNRNYRFLFNDGNFAQDLEYVDERYPEDLHKDGLLSHEYSFEGEELYYSRQYLNWDATGFDNRARGEIQDIYEEYWWNYAPVKQAFALACSGASGGLDMTNITPKYISSIFNDTRPMEFYEKYAGLRKPLDRHVGFIALRDVPDFDDSIRFPTATYGPIIDPAQKTKFDRKIYNIEHNTKDSAERKYWLSMKANGDFLNLARVDKIVEQFRPFGAMHSEVDQYHNDFGLNMTKNFRRYMSELDIDSLSYGAWRIGPDTSIYGRYARLCKLQNGKGAMYFEFENDGDSLVRKGQSLDITVTYYDSGNGQWSLLCSNKSFKVTNTNTRQWLQKKITIASFLPRVLYNNRADIGLKYVSSTNTPFALIEVAVTGPQVQNENVKVQREAMDLKLSPDPNEGQFKVSFTAKKEDRYSVSITDESGELYYKEARTGTAGNNAWYIAPLKLGRGAYILHIESATTTGETKFLVVK